MAATIGAANAAGGGAPAAPALPAGARADAERAACESLRARAEAAGLGSARLFGHTARPVWHAGDTAHALLGLPCLALAAAGLTPGGWALLVVALSAGLRAAGLPALDLLLLRRPAWSLVLRPPGAHTRVLHVAVADADPVRPALPRLTLAALLGALAALPLGSFALALAALGLVAVAGAAAWAARPPAPRLGSPEALAADELLSRAAAAPPELALVVSGGASVDGHGIAALLDWRGLAPGALEIVVHGAPAAAARAAAGLSGAGWRARPALPPESPS